MAVKRRRRKVGRCDKKEDEPGGKMRKSWQKKVTRGIERVVAKVGRAHRMR